MLLAILSGKGRNSISIFRKASSEEFIDKK